MAETQEAARLASIWTAIYNKLVICTRNYPEDVQLLVKLVVIWRNAAKKGDLGKMRQVIAWGDELKAPYERAAKDKEAAARQSREAKLNRQLREQRRRQERVANQRSALDEALKNLKPGKAPVQGETQGLAEAERLYREREHIVAHGKKKARPSKKGKSRGG